MDRNSFDSSGFFSVYVIRNERGRRYVGKTCDIPRRLRQHNREISGGAKATRTGTWRLEMVINGFETDSQALQAEWRMKRPPGSRKKRNCSAADRLGAVCRARLSLGLGWTSSSPPPSEQSLCVLSTDDDAPLQLAVPETWGVERMTSEGILAAFRFPDV